MYDRQRNMEEQSTAVWTQEQYEGDEYTREDDEEDGEDSYWNYVDEQ